MIPAVVRRPILSAPDFGEPKCAILTRCDCKRLAGWGGQGILGDPTASGDTPNFIAVVFRKPQRAVRASCNPARPAIGGGHRIFGNHSSRGDAPDVISEPGVALILDIDLKLREQPSVADEVSIL
jgi:hypothetical protein